MGKANKKLQSAAGIFLQLKEGVMGAIEQEPTPDLEPEALSVLSSLCLAQAQEMVVQKAMKDNMKQYCGQTGGTCRRFVR